MIRFSLEIIIKVEYQNNFSVSKGYNTYSKHTSYSCQHIHHSKSKINKKHKYKNFLFQGK